MDGTLHIIQITDTHLFATDGPRMHDVDSRESLARVLAAIAADESPDLLLVTGDIAQDESRDAYRRLAEALAPLNVPVLALAGNHDDAALMADVFARTAISVDKLHDFDHWRILQLHSPVAGETHGWLEPAELDWLDTALAVDRPTLICLHHPPLAVGTQWLDAIGLTNTQEFFNVVDRHETVRAVVAGHVHQESYVRRGAVDYFTTPSTSVQFRPGVPQPAFDTLAPGYRRLRLHPDGGVESEVVRVGTAG
ncbi:MAG TPA: phosphodiesterase [Gammaproteobacteria bacterium]|nr:phosphodiesterase [Gammaproteobacteria bacterium]